MTSIHIQQNRKPYDIRINNNAKEPKIRPNLKFSEKHRFRTYKSKVEPRLLSKIMLDEEDNIVHKLQQLLNQAIPKKNTNYEEIETTPAPAYVGVDNPPEIMSKISSRRGEDSDLSKFETKRQDVSDISQIDAENLLQSEQQNDSAKKLQQFLRRKIDNQYNSQIQEDFQMAQLLDMTVSPIKRGNQVIGLEFHDDSQGPAKRGVGRPKGSKNKDTIKRESASLLQAAVRRKLGKS